jgi:ABC-type branched-subunit amino acid transport system substrate-binding protein
LLRSLLWPAAVVLPLFLLGCPPDDGSVPPSFPGLEATPEPAASPGATPAAGTPTAEATPAAAATPAPARQDRPAETVKACILLPASGPARDDGAEMRRGIQLAQDQLKVEDWRTRQVVWEEHDTKSSEPGAVTAYMKCVATGVPVVIGPVHPAPKTAIIPVAAAHDAVLVIPEVGAAVPTLWSDNIFSVAPPASDMGGSAAGDAAKAKGLKKAAVLHTAGTFGENIRDSFKKAFEAEGGAVVHVAALAENKADAWAAAAKVAVLEKGAQAVLVIGPADPALAIARTLDANGMVGAHVWYIDWAMYPPVLDAAQSANAIQRVHWVNRKRPVGDFAATFESKYQAKPRYEAGSGYDAVMLVANAVENAKSLWFEDIAQALKTTQGHPSAFGTGEMVEVRGLSFVDVAGYSILEPASDPDSTEGKYLFGEPQ